MAKKAFFPKDLGSQLLWLVNFIAALPAYAAKYGISLVQLGGLQADKEWLSYWFGLHEQTKNYMEGLTEYKNEAAYGVPAGGTAISTIPSPPAPGIMPTPVNPGVFPRALAIANGIKAHIDYTPADGDVLGLEGAEIEEVDLSTARPVLKPKIAGDYTDVGWDKQGLPVDGVEIHVKRGAAVYIFLATDTTTPKYVDTFPHPATEEKWTYKGIFVKNGQRVSLWSEEVSITVKAG